MPTLDGKLKTSEVALTPEEWEINKDCTLKKRDHKWQWKFDIEAGRTSDTQAICVHCGIERELTRKDIP